MSILNQLSEPFPKEVERQLKKGGASLTYIPVSEVITRLNRVFGIDGWSSTITYCKRDELDPDYIVASVTLSARIGNKDDAIGGWVGHDGIGGQKIKRTKNGDIVDLGDEMKGAVSDALKKAAQHFGIGLYLARSEDALAYEESVDSAEMPISQDHFNKLRELLNSLSEDLRIKAKEYWDTIGGGTDFAAQNITNTMLSDILDFVKSARSEESS